MVSWVVFEASCIFLAKSQGSNFSMPAVAMQTLPASGLWRMGETVRMADKP